MMISAHMRTGKRFVAVRQCVTVEFSTAFLCVHNYGDTLLARWRISLLCGSSRRFCVKSYIPSLKDACDFFSALGVVEYSQNCMIKKNATAISWPMDVFRWVFVCL